MNDDKKKIEFSDDENMVIHEAISRTIAFMNETPLLRGLTPEFKERANGNEKSLFFTTNLHKALQKILHTYENDMRIMIVKNIIDISQEQKANISYKRLGVMVRAVESALAHSLELTQDIPDNFSDNDP